MCIQLNAFKREIRDDQEEAQGGVLKKLKASDKLVFNKKSNEMNFESFEALASLEKRKLEQGQESLEEGKRLDSVRMKEILLADNLLQVFLRLILTISLLACAATAVKMAIIGEIA